MPDVLMKSKKIAYSNGKVREEIEVIVEQGKHVVCHTSLMETNAMFERSRSVKMEREIILARCTEGQRSLNQTK